MSALLLRLPIAIGGEGAYCVNDMDFRLKFWIRVIAQMALCMIDVSSELDQTFTRQCVNGHRSLS